MKDVLTKYEEWMRTGHFPKMNTAELRYMLAHLYNRHRDKRN